MRLRLDPERLMWLTPVAIFVVMRYSPVGFDKLLVVAIAFAAVVALSRWPAGALTALIVGIPFHLLILSTLYRLGMPGGIVRPLSSWKEGMIAAVAVAGIRRAVTERHRVDLIDKVVLALVVIGLLYLFLPAVVLGRADGALISFSDRLLGFRTDVLYLVLFLACRHLRLDARACRRLLARALTVATLASLVGIYEWSFSSQWNDFVVNTLRVPQFQVDVLGVDPLDLGQRLFDIRSYGVLGGREFVRVGGPMLDYLAFGFFLAIALAVVCELQVRGGGRPWMIAAMPVLGAALLFTQTRAALIATAVSLLLVMRPHRGRSTRHRLRFIFVIGALLVFAVPAVLGAGLSDRFAGDNSSDTAHRSALNNGIATMFHHPIGLGLTTAAGAAQRLSSKSFIVAENQYLQVGLQLGVTALLLYGALAVLLIRQLRRAASGTDDAPIAVTGVHDLTASPDEVVTASVARTMLIGLFLGGLFLQPFIEFAVSWTAWAIAGIGLGGIDVIRSAPTEQSNGSPLGPSSMQDGMLA